MCLQDLRISRRLSRRQIVMQPPGSLVYLPIDLTRVSMIDIQDEGNATKLVRATDEQAGRYIPTDTTVGTSPAAGIVYTRRAAGADFGCPAWIEFSSAEIAVVTIHEYDSETMREIYGPLKG